MYEFFYHVKFKVVNDKLDVKVFLSLDDLFTPVYIKMFDSNILKDKKLFTKFYKEIVEYLDYKRIVMNEADLRLLHQTLVNFAIELPKIISIELNKYDEALDNYCNMLTPKELVFIQYADGKAIDDKRFKSWEEDNNLDTKDLRLNLVENNILTTDDYEFNLRKAKRELLLEVVTKYELDIHGDNNDLIEGIARELPDDIIKEHFSGTHYSLTKKGSKLLEKCQKLLDFNRSYYRTINKLSLEEFHLLSIKKEDYDFSGIGRLLMINTNNIPKQLFDWDKLDSLDEIVIEEEKEIDIDKDDIIDLIDEINMAYVDDSEEESELDYTEIDEDEIHIDINPKIEQQLESYKQRREMYDKQKQKSGLYTEEVYSEKSKSKLLIFIIILFGVIGLAFGLLFLNEKLNLIDLPFTLKDIFEALKETFKDYKDKIEGLFK